MRISNNIIIVHIYGLSLFNIVDENYLISISKYRRHNFAYGCLLSGGAL